MLSTSKTDDEYYDDYYNIYWGTSSLVDEKLFFLSAEEVSDKYGYFNGDESRVAIEYDEDGSKAWWLRSPYSSNTGEAAVVREDGSVDKQIVNEPLGARPAFNFNLTSVLFTSAATGGKSSGVTVAGVLSPIPDNTANEWKLTLKDPGRSGFSASAGTGANLLVNEGYSEWSVPVVYSGASDTYDNDYVSVILADSSNKALYYGNIANQSKASSDAGQEVNIPAGLSAGSYKLYVFSEQVNGDKHTDYASAFKTINLTVNATPVKTCTVTFNAAGGTWPDGTTADKKVNVEKGHMATAPEAPAREGFTFDGWDTDYNNVTTDLTVKAKWKENPTPPEPIEAAVPTGKTLTYNGKTQTGVAAGTGYTLSGTTSAVKAGTYQATAALKEGYVWSDGTSDPKQINWKINKATVKVTAPTGKTFTYNGKAKTGVASGADYTLSGTVKAAKAGSYTAKAALKTNADYTYQWADGTTAVKTVKWKINKANNPLVLKPKTAAVKYSKVKNKAQTLIVTKVIKFTKQIKDKKTYTLVSAKKDNKSFKKYFKINKKTGKVTVKAGLMKGTYNVKIKVKAAGNKNYKASKQKAVTFKITVK